MANTGWLAGVAGAGRCAAPHPRAGPGLAQRPGGQQPAVADAAIVEDADFHIAGQCRVLQAVVAHQDVDLRMGCAQRGGVQALWGHEHRHAGAAGQQQRLVAHILGAAGAAPRGNPGCCGHSRAR
jgi:hypothetical protein